MSGTTLSERVNRLFEKEKWEAARKLLLKALDSTPDDHWLLTRIGTTYYEERDYATALDYTKRAVELDPECPLVLWDLAGTLAMLKRYPEAAYSYLKLLRRGMAIGSDECGEGAEWARALLTDTLFRLAECCRRMEKYDLARSFLVGHQQLVSLGNVSLYSQEDVQQEYEALGLSSETIIEENLQRGAAEFSPVT